MERIPLTQEQQVATGYDTLIKITHADLTETATATAQVISLKAVDIYEEAQRVGFYLVTPFEDISDAAFNDVAITIGDGGSANRLLTTKQVNLNGTEILAFAGTNTSGYVFLAADTIDITFGSMTAKSLVNIDNGELWVFVKTAKLANVG